MDRENSIKKQSRIRLWFQAAWFVLTNGYVRGYTKGMIFNGNTKVICLPGLNCYSCPGALGSCPMGALQAVLGNASYRVSLYVFGMISAMGVLFGRLICGWMCPFGLFQDLMYRIKVKGKKKNMPGHRYLKYLRYVILVVFPILLVSLMLDVTGASMPWFCEWICPSGMLLGAIPLVAVNSGLRAAVGARFFWKLFILLAITVLAIFYYRPFCKYLCPLGAIYGLFNPISSYRLVIDKEKCVSCATCQKACGMDIRTFETPNSPDCIRCGSCMAACPTGAIESTWGRMGQKIKSRCFRDDGDILPARKKEAETTAYVPSDEGIALSVSRGKAVFLGILMLIAGTISLILSVLMPVVSNLSSHFLIDIYQNTNVASVFMGILWCVASVIVILTGVYTIRFRKLPERLTSINEKLRAAWIIALIGVAIGAAGAVANIKTLSSFFTPMLLNPFIYACVPVLMLQVRMMCRETEGKKCSRGLWVIMSIVNILLALSTLLVLIILNLGS